MSMQKIGKTEKSKKLKSTTIIIVLLSLLLMMIGGYIANEKYQQYQERQKMLAFFH